MPQLGLFDSFDNLDQILPEDIAAWLKSVPQLTYLENYLANRILYPQSLPLKESDMQLDLAILREALRMSQNLVTDNALLGGSPFLNTTLRKILIPARFLELTPSIGKLTQVFIDALLLSRRKEDWFGDLWTVVVTDDTDEVVGSCLLAQFEGSGGVMKLKLFGKDYEIKQGALTVIPCSKDRCEISYKLQNGRFLGRAESAVEVYGGRLGLVIDGRST